MFFPECSESTQTLQMLNNFLIFENLAPCPGNIKIKSGNIWFF